MAVAEKHQGDGIRPLRPAAALLGPAILLLAVAGFYWKLTLTDQYTWLDGPDLAYQVLPWLQFQAGEWHAGRLPLWDPYQWYGQPQVGQGQPGAACPLNWLLFLLPLRDGWIRHSHLNWYFVLVHLLGAWFCYLLARDLGRGQPGAVAAGLSFSLGGYLGSIDWPQMMNGAIWAPLVLLFQLRVARGRHPWRSAALSGFFLGVSWLSGHHQIPIFVSLAWAGIWAYIIAAGRLPRWRGLMLAAAAGLMALFAGALQTLPAVEYGRLAKRWVGVTDPVGWNQPVPYTVHAEYGLQPGSLVGLLVPGAFRHTDPFVGITALSLALLGLVRCWRDSQVKLLAVLAALGLFVSLGGHSLLHGLLYASAPFVEKARSPGMAIFIFHLGLAPLIAYGVDTFLLKDESGWTSRVAAAAGWFGAGVFAVALALRLCDKPLHHDRVLVVALAGLLLMALFRAWIRGAISHATVCCVIVLLLLQELSIVSGFVWANRSDTGRNQIVGRLARHSEIVEFLRRQPRPFRVELREQEVPYNFGDWHGVEASGGYLASVTSNLYQVPFHELRFRRAAGVRYYVAKEPPEGGQKEVFRDAAGLRVFEDAAASLPAWMVHEAIYVPSLDSVGHSLSKPEFEYKSQAIVTEPIADLDRCQGDEPVLFEERHAGYVRLLVEARCRGLLVLADTWYPGWKASVDGRSSAIHQVNGAMRGVVVEAGAHRVEFRYRPLSVFLGAAMTLLAGLAALIIAIRPRRVHALAAAILCLPLAGCLHTPESYPPPIQRAPPPQEEASPVGAMVKMSDINAEAYLLSDVSGALEGGRWRWTFQRPQLRFFVKSTRNTKFLMEFVVAEATFKETGPFSIQLYLNGKPWAQIPCSAPGEQLFERPVPAGWLKPGAINVVAAQADKLWVSPTDGAKLGFMLVRAGFLE